MVSLLAVAGVALLLYVLKWFFFSRRSPGPNPFRADSRLPPQPFVADRAIRKAVLKKQFALSAVPADLDAIVIGSGIGGLTAAALLAKAGKRVLVLEQHDQAGGCCHTFKEKGFEFDTGIHYIGETANNTLMKFLLDQLTDGQLQWNSLEDQYDQVLIGDFANHPKIVEIWRDGDGSDGGHFKRGLLKSFPHEERAIDEFISTLQKCRATTYGFVGVKFLPVWLGRLLAKTGLMKAYTDFFKFSQRTVKEVLEEITPNRELQAVFAYPWGDYGTPPASASFAMHANLMNHFFRGGAYPIGGASEIPFHIIPLIRRSGGEVLCRCRVMEILVDPARGSVVGVGVQNAGGQVIRAPLVISDAGAYNTFTSLLPAQVADAYGLTARLRRLKHGMGSMTVYVGLRGSNEENKLVARNSWAFQGPDLDRLYQDYIRLPVDEALNHDVPLMFISFPSTKDPLWNTNHPNKATCEIVTLVPFEWFAPWEKNRCGKRGEDYDTFKTKLAERMWRNVLLLFPHLHDKVEYFDVGTPLTNQFYLNSPRGEIYGVDHDVERFSPDAVIDTRPDTPITGLYMTGQDVFTAGFAGALFGGVISASAVLNRNLMTDLMALKSKSAPCAAPRAPVRFIA